MAVRVPIYGREGIVAHAIVDDSDADAVTEHRWNLSPNGYAITAVRVRRYVHRRLRMHRLVLGLSSDDPRTTHHRNGDKLDNRLENLVIVDHSRHMRFHAQHRRGRLSGPPFRARVMVNGRRFNLGRFQTEPDARAAVEQWLSERGLREEI